MPQSHWETKRLLLVEVAEQSKLLFCLSQTHFKSKNHFSSIEETEVWEELGTEVWDFETGKIGQLNYLFAKVPMFSLFILLMT